MNQTDYGIAYRECLVDNRRLAAKNAALIERLKGLVRKLDMEIELADGDGVGRISLDTVNAAKVYRKELQKIIDEAKP